MRQQQRSWFPAMFANTFQILMYLYNILTVIILRIRDVDLLTNAYGWVGQKTGQSFLSQILHTHCFWWLSFISKEYFRFYHVVKGFWLVFLARILQAYWILLRYYMNSIECDSASKKYSVILSNNIQCKEAVHTGWKREETVSFPKSGPGNIYCRMSTQLELCILWQWT